MPIGLYVDLCARFTEVSRHDSHRRSSRSGEENLGGVDESDPDSRIHLLFQLGCGWGGRDEVGLQAMRCPDTLLVAHVDRKDEPFELVVVGARLELFRRNSVLA